MKKLLSFLLALGLAVSFVACGGGASTETESTEDALEAVEETAEEAIEEVEEATEEVMEEADSTAAEMVEEEATEE